MENAASELDGLGIWVLGIPGLHDTLLNTSASDGACWITGHNVARRRRLEALSERSRLAG